MADKKKMAKSKVVKAKAPVLTPPKGQLRMPIVTPPTAQPTSMRG